MNKLVLGVMLLGACEIRQVFTETDAQVDPHSLHDAAGGIGGTGGGGAGGTGGTGGIHDAGPMPDCSPDLMNDPANCGMCGHVCSYANANPVCTLGVCTMGSCLPGFVDLDHSDTNGCEYMCTPTNGGVERCDGVDNDCNGTIDDGFNTQTDVNNCGGCGIVCSLAHASPGCTGGQCVIASCAPGFQNANGVAADGCECQLTNGGTEICDGIDNDCNGVVDDVAPGSLSNDPQHCGSCSNNCTTLPHAVGGCANNQCTIASCAFGYVNLNGVVSDGCEYACIPSGPEVCDGRDNDCNGLTDTQDPGLQVPANFCNHTGECAIGTDGMPSHPVCMAAPSGTVEWICNYKSTVQTTAPNQIISQETLCDGKDNDCDGQIDESFPNKGQFCSDNGVGACKRTGTFICTINGASTICNLTSPQVSPTDEVCDGIDNDCDGIVDEIWDDTSGTRCGGATPRPCLGVRDSVVHVQRTVGTQSYNFYIYQYEASRLDASASSPGSLSARSCSRPNVRGWQNVAFAQAQAACQAAGMRLCNVTRDGSGNVTRDEWGAACGGTSQTNYPYGNNYGTTTCDGRDFADPDAQVPTGSLAGCTTPDSIFDLSGDLAEWTNDPHGMTSDGRQAYTLRGGSYDTIANGLQCGFMFDTVPLDFVFPDTGFRCCTICAPGQAECSGSCKNLGTDNANCGACAHACGTGTSCQNGVCR